MAVYLLSFAVSLMLIAFSEKRRKEYFIFFSVIALLIPCLLAGFRAETVGTDVLVYVKPMVEAAKNADGFKDYWNSSWFSVWRDKFVYEHEIGFAALVFAVTKLTGSLPMVLFAIQAVTVVPIFAALAKNRKNAPVWPGMLVYYLLYYNSTLNMMRQWMAMGLLLLAFRMLSDKRYGWCAVWTLLAITFHYSAIIVFPVYFVWWALKLFSKRTFKQGDIQLSSKMVVVILIFCVGFVVITNLDLVLRLMVAAGFGRFSNYLTGNGISLLLSQIILRLPVLGVSLFTWKKLKNATTDAYFFLTMILLDLLASQISSITAYAFRIAFYFAIYAILAVPYLFKYQKTHFEKTVVALLLGGFFCVYWYYTYVHLGSHQTVPYEIMR